MVIGLDQADKEQFACARNYFSRLKQRHEILWNDGPGLRSINDTLARSNLSPSEPGKGRNVWYKSEGTHAWPLLLRKAMVKLNLAAQPIPTPGNTSVTTTFINPDPEY